ncbi:hypothetical protein PLICRDRAFT_52190 [Plicaturopsis crispa FD-325 SS-3]|nr:hypothetical protein PLICRDRAFT_52190 [Plicaturopsis crispa FD-325 SS-3]
MSRYPGPARHSYDDPYYAGSGRDGYSDYPVYHYSPHEPPYQRARNNYGYEDAYNSGAPYADYQGDAQGPSQWYEPESSYRTDPYGAQSSYGPVQRNSPQPRRDYQEGYSYGSNGYHVSDQQGDYRELESYDSYNRNRQAYLREHGGDGGQPTHARQYHSRAESASPTPPGLNLLPSKSHAAPSPTPPPPPPRSPSPTYLATSLQKSTPLSSPTDLRKLLIMDLNGTLVIRLTSNGKRVAKPRAYMPSFRRYIFAPQTREWLDAMVWSSAQPRNVSDMVEKSFGALKEQLLAVWGRDTLGLSEHDYNRKIQTTKDLTTPWTKLPLSTEGGSSSQAHSALTTLLLDDTPLKAFLQPYNHICIKEYDTALRKNDLWVHEEGVWIEEEDSKEKTRRSLYEVHVKEASNKKRKRGKKIIPPQLSPLRKLLDPHKQFDPTLLAVIGILDTIKLQSNVAGWIRDGGLWGPGGAPSSRSTSPVDEDDPGHAPVEPEATVNTGNDQGEPASPVAEPLSSSSPKSKNVVEKSISPEPTPAPNLMWFENEATVAYWVEQGEKALKELNIPVIHGIAR